MRSRIKSVSSAAVVLLGFTLGIRLQGAAAQDRLLQETVEFTGAVLFLEHKVPGLVIGAIRGPERAVAGFGETKKATGFRPDERTVFRIGSVTKAFTGEVLASLVAENTIKLTDPLQKHLGWDVAVPSRDEKVVRLVDLATHAEGSHAKSRMRRGRPMIRLRRSPKKLSRSRSLAISSSSPPALARS